MRESVAAGGGILIRPVDGGKLVHRGLPPRGIEVWIQLERPSIAALRFAGPARQIERIAERIVNLREIRVRRKHRAEFADRLFHATEFLERCREVDARRERFRVVRQYTSVHGFGLLRAAEVLQHIPEVVQRRKVIGNRFDRRPERGFGLRRAPRLGDHYSKRVEDRGVAGIEGARPSKALLGVREPAFPVEQIAEPRPRVGILWPEGRRSTQALLGCDGLAELHQCAAKLGVNLGVVPAQGEGLLEATPRVRGAPRGEIRRSKIVERAGTGSADPMCPLDQLDRLAGHAPTDRDYPEQVERRCVSRVSGESGPAGLLGLAPAACLRERASSVQASR